MPSSPGTALGAFENGAMPSCSALWGLLSPQPQNLVSRVSSWVGLLPVPMKEKIAVVNSHLLCTPGSFGSSLPHSLSSILEFLPLHALPLLPLQVDGNSYQLS